MQQMKKSRLIYLSLLSGLLLIPAWYELGTGLILLFAMIPLLFVEDYFYQNKTEHRPHKVFFYAAITFFTWNAGCTWWLWNATVAGMILAFLINTLLMSIIFWLFHITRRNTSSSMGYFKKPFFICHRRSKASLFVAKKFAFQQCFRYSATINRNKPTFLGSAK